MNSSGEAAEEEGQEGEAVELLLLFCAVANGAWVKASVAVKAERREGKSLGRMGGGCRRVGCWDGGGGGGGFGFGLGLVLRERLRRQSPLLLLWLLLLLLMLLLLLLLLLLETLQRMAILSLPCRIAVSRNSSSCSGGAVAEVAAAAVVVVGEDGKGRGDKGMEGDRGGEAMEGSRRGGGKERVSQASIDFTVFQHIYMSYIRS